MLGVDSTAMGCRRLRAAITRRLSACFSTGGPISMLREANSAVRWKRLRTTVTRRSSRFSSTVAPTIPNLAMLLQLLLCYARPAMGLDGALLDRASLEY